MRNFRKNTFLKDKEDEEMRARARKQAELMRERKRSIQRLRADFAAVADGLPMDALAGYERHRRELTARRWGEDVALRCGTAAVIGRELRDTEDSLREARCALRDEIEGLDGRVDVSQLRIGRVRDQLEAVGIRARVLRTVAAANARLSFSRSGTWAELPHRWPLVAKHALQRGLPMRYGRALLIDFGLSEARGGYSFYWAVFLGGNGEGHTVRRVIVMQDETGTSVITGASTMRGQLRAWTSGVARRVTASLRTGDLML